MHSRRDPSRHLVALLLVFVLTLFSSIGWTSANEVEAEIPSADTSVVTVRARGRTGEENMELRINGLLAASWDGVSTTMTDYSQLVSSPTTVQSIRVHFTNDAGWPEADRNLIVDKITIDGRAFESEAAPTKSSGSWDSATGCAEGHKTSEWLHCLDAWFAYEAAVGSQLAGGTPPPPEPTPTPTPEPGAITVRARGSQGTENIELRINGATIAGWNSIGTTFSDFTTTVTEQTTIETLRVHFTNNGGWPEADRNAVIDHIRINDTIYETEDPSTHSTATWTAATGCTPGNKTSEWLHCDNGYFQYNATNGITLSPTTTPTPEPEPAPTPEPGSVPGPVSHEGTALYTVQAPGSDLARLVAEAPVGASFYFPNGSYRFADVVPKDDMTFIGESTAGVVVDGTGHENAFHGTADGVSFAKMTFENFNGLTTSNPQEQAPIRGTSAIWASNRGQMATNWLIEDIVSRNNVGSGLFLGDHFVVRDSEFYSNGITGMAGDAIVGGLIYRNKFHHNSGSAATGVYSNGGGMKLTQAGSAVAPVVVRNNEVYENNMRGLWCDIGCEGFYVFENNIYNHSVAAVVLELSENARVLNNTITDSNEWTDFINSNFNGAAITIAETKNVLIEGNVVTNAKAAVAVHHAERPHGAVEATILTYERYPTLNFDTEDVTVRDNTFQNIQNIGISTGTTGHIAKPETIVFKHNNYTPTTGVNFWWTSKTPTGYAEWQAAGRQ